jgi:hypothetical protein
MGRSRGYLLRQKMSTFHIIISINCQVNEDIARAHSATRLPAAEKMTGKFS